MGGITRGTVGCWQSVIEKWGTKWVPSGLRSWLEWSQHSPASGCLISVPPGEEEATFHPSRLVRGQIVSQRNARTGIMGSSVGCFSQSAENITKLSFFRPHFDTCG